jgi:hypothetical protein
LNVMPRIAVQQRFDLRRSFSCRSLNTTTFGESSCDSGRNINSRRSSHESSSANPASAMRDKLLIRGVSLASERRGLQP